MKEKSRYRYKIFDDAGLPLDKGKGTIEEIEASIRKLKKQKLW